MMRARSRTESPPSGFGSMWFLLDSADLRQPIDPLTNIGNSFSNVGHAAPATSVCMVKA